MSRKWILMAVVIASVAASALWMATRIMERRRHRAALREAAVPKTSSPELELSGFTRVAGTDVLRAKLDERRGGGGFTSYKSRRATHNVLFVNAADGAGTWLLEDDDHQITDFRDIPAGTRYAATTSTTEAPTATLALVKQGEGDLDLLTGRLLLVTPAGRRVVEVASNVRVVSGATLDQEGNVLLVYERERRYELVRFDRSLREIDRHEVRIPKLE